MNSKEEAVIGAPAARNRRRILVVDSRFQYGYLLRSTFVFAVITILSFLTSFFLLAIWYGPGRIEHEPWHGLPRLILLAVFLTVSATGYLCLLGSHRIAGPMYRLKRSCERVAAGDLTFDVAFRATDSFKDVAASFTQMIQSLREREERNSNHIRVIEEECTALIRMVEEERDTDALRDGIRGAAARIWSSAHTVRNGGPGK